MATGLLSVTAISQATPSHMNTTSYSHPGDSSNNTSNQMLMLRLNEIKMTDKASLSFKEKRALRKEVREIDKQMQENNGGIYFSAGALVIIILLLIILL